jgi:DNA-binding response OmpR family regulator
LAATTPGAAPARVVRVLVVDDDPDNADSLGELLRLYGHRCVVAYDCRDALELAHSLLPQLALVHLGMAGAPGLARWLVYLERPPLLVAVTGHSDADHRLIAAEAGFTRYLVKPAALGEILDAVSDAGREP